MKALQSFGAIKSSLLLVSFLTILSSHMFPANYHPISHHCNFFLHKGHSRLEMLFSLAWTIRKVHVKYSWTMMCLCWQKTKRPKGMYYNYMQATNKEILIIATQKRKCKLIITYLYTFLASPLHIMFTVSMKTRFWSTTKEPISEIIYPIFRPIDQ